MSEGLSFSLVSPEKELYSGNVTSVTVPGAEGDFTVTVNHSACLSTLRPGFLTLNEAVGTSSTYYVQGGFAEVNEGGLTVLVERAIERVDFSTDILDSEISSIEEAIANAKIESAKQRLEARLLQFRDLKLLEKSAH